MQDLHGSLCYHNTAHEATSVIPTIKFCPWPVQLHEPFSQFVPLSFPQQSLKNHWLVLLELLLLVAFKFPVALVPCWAAHPHPHFIRDVVVTHRASLSFWSFSVRVKQSSTSFSLPYLSSFPKNCSAPCCCTRPLLCLLPFPYTVLLLLSAPFEQFLLSFCRHLNYLIYKQKSILRICWVLFKQN